MVALVLAEYINLAIRRAGGGLLLSSLFTLVFTLFRFLGLVNTWLALGFSLASGWRIILSSLFSSVFNLYWLLGLVISLSALWFGLAASQCT